MSSQTILAFDVYGTLLSTDSIAQELAKHLGEDNASTVAAAWRRHQLEYTWLLNSMNQYLDFRTITSNSLHQTLTEHSLSLSQEAKDSVIRAYDALSAFPDVGPGLKAVSAASGIAAVVFSNGTDSMVSNSIHSSPDLGPHAAVFSQIVTVEEVKCYKPKPEVYHHLAKKLGKSTERESMEEIWLVSSNPFDIIGARTVGMNAIWVNRGRGGWTHNLLGGKDEGKPTAVVRSLAEVLKVVNVNTRN